MTKKAPIESIRLSTEKKQQDSFTLITKGLQLQAKGPGAIFALILLVGCLTSWLQ